MRKTLLPTILAIALAAAMMAAPSAAHADIADYYAGDIAVIEGVIDNNGLNWPKATDAVVTVDDTWMDDNWPGVTWSTGASDRRIVELDLSLDTLQGSLDVSGLSAMRVLNCSDHSFIGTSITEIDLSGCVALEYLDCSDCFLSQLDLSGCPALEYLDCSRNWLTALNLSANPLLTYLDCLSNVIFPARFDISANTALEYLSCAGNRLYSLDISHLVNLTSFNGGQQRVEYIILNRISSGPYTVTVQMNETIVFGNAALSYSEGVLTCIDDSVSGSSFSSELDSAQGWILSGYLYLLYTTQYTITFNPNGGTVNPTSAVTVRFENGVLAELPVPTRSGYEFAGWFTAPTGGTLVTLETEFEQDTTIYARWIPIEAPAPQPTTPPTGDVAGLMAASTSLLAAVGAGGALTIRRRRRTT